MVFWVVVGFLKICVALIIFKLLTPWVLCWHIRICHDSATPLSAVLAYLCMPWYYLQEYWNKIGSSKDFLMNFFCLLAVLPRNPVKGKEKTLQQYFTLWFILLKEKRQKKYQKLSTGGSSFHLKSALKGLRAYFLMKIH